TGRLLPRRELATFASRPLTPSGGLPRSQCDGERAAQSAVALLFTFGRNGTDRRNVATGGREAPQGYVAGVSLVRAHTAWGACNPCPRLPVVCSSFSRASRARVRDAPIVRAVFALRHDA